MNACKHEANRWLIYRAGAVGDTLLLSSLIQAIRQANPRVWIEVMGVFERVELLVGEGLADRAVSNEMEGVETVLGEEGLNENFRKYLADFDFILWFSHADAERLETKLQVREGQCVRVHKALPNENTWKKHAVEHYMEAVRGWLEWETIPDPKIQVMEADRNYVQGKLRAQGSVHPNHKLIAVHIGAGSVKKRAPLRRFAECLNTFPDPYHLVLIQGPADREAVEEGMAYFTAQCHVSVFAEESLRAVGALLARADYYIGNDSGVSHLAAAVGCPSTVFFVSSNPAIWRPLGPSVEIQLLRQTG
ncbi:hypothetical protein GF373_08885 [bacterium]|nr:hypothetical protein [bacterium]